MFPTRVFWLWYGMDLSQGAPEMPFCLCHSIPGSPSVDSNIATRREDASSPQRAPTDSLCEEIWEGESQETTKKLNDHYQKIISLSYSRTESSASRWKICLCAEHKVVEAGLDKRQGTNAWECAWKTLPCPDFVRISKGEGASKQLPGWESHF